MVEDRNVFVKDCLRKDLRRYCWVQKQADDVELLELYETGQLKRDQGHRFEKSFMLTITNHSLSGPMRIACMEEI